MVRCTVVLLAGMLMISGAIPAQPGEGQPPAPSSAAAKEAQARHDAAVKRAEDAYKESVIAAKKALVKELEDALKVAMKAGDLKEANAINALKETVVREIGDLSSGGPIVKRKPKVVTIKVSVKERWKTVGKVLKGEVLEFSVTGEWVIAAVTRDRPWGPDGDGNRAMFMAKVNDRLYRVGSKNTIEVEEDGTLYIGCDESQGGGSGEMTATIKLYRGGK